MFAVVDVPDIGFGATVNAAVGAEVGAAVGAPIKKFVLILFRDWSTTTNDPSSRTRGASERTIANTQSCQNILAK